MKRMKERRVRSLFHPFPPPKMIGMGPRKRMPNPLVSTSPLPLEKMPSRMSIKPAITERNPAAKRMEARLNPLHPIDYEEKWNHKCFFPRV